jgi:hypothetical protein
VAEYEYEWSEFVIPARNHNGESETVSLVMQPGQYRQAQIFVQSRTFPYKTVGDLFRHAIMRHLQWLEEEEGRDISMIAASDDINYVVRDDDFFRSMESVFHSMADKVQRHIDAGDHRDAQKLLTRIREKIEKLPDMGWRERFKRFYVHRFDGYLAPEFDPTKVQSKVVMMGQMAVGGRNGVVRQVPLTDTDSDVG